MIKTLCIESAEILLNQALKADPDSALLLTPLHGKALLVEITACKVHGQAKILVLPTPSKLCLRVNSDTTASATLKGTLSHWINFAKHHKNATALQQSGIKVEGDLGTLQAYQKFAEQLTIEWEAVLAAVVGDTLAYTLSKPLKMFYRFAKKNMQSTLQDITETLQEEKRLLVPKAEIEDFFSDIAKLRQDVNRLAARTT